MRVTADGKVHRSAAEWSEIFDSFDKSRLSREKFCEREHIHAASFARWHRKLRSSQRRSEVTLAETNSQTAQESFVEITPQREELAPWTVELELPGGCVLRLRS